MHRSLTLLAAAALSWIGWTALRKSQQRLAARSKAKPEALQTWEGEGGGLPDGGPGASVTPAAGSRDTPA